jgi:diaminopimelate decarboxylase
VIWLKQGEGRDFLILDAAMNDLIRPRCTTPGTTSCRCVEPRRRAPICPVDVVGPVCETGDTFARGRPMPPLAEGDLVAFRSAGAYGAVMASEYNPPADPRGDGQGRSLCGHPPTTDL